MGAYTKDYNVAMCKIVANEILYITPLHLTSNQILPNKYCKCWAYKLLNQIVKHITIYISEKLATY